MKEIHAMISGPICTVEATLDEADDGKDDIILRMSAELKKHIQSMIERNMPVMITLVGSDEDDEPEPASEPGFTGTCPDCGGPVRYYNNYPITKVICADHCQGWKVIKRIDHSKKNGDE